MVYYHTSGNVKVLRNIILDYSAASEISPYEYMRTYIEKCPDTMEDAKISWIAETFLGIQKHSQFLKAISSHMSEELSSEDQDYFMIIFHALIYDIGPQEMQYLYKCIFNLSKPLLNTFTDFLSNNEVLTFISQVAQSSYDANYITEKIVGPLFTWQPYISEMAHSYAEYIKKIESRKVKPPTVPIHPNVLTRKSREAGFSGPATLPATPPNSLRVKGTKKMVTKSTIDQKLKQQHDKNKQRAEQMLNEVKTKDFHFAQDKSDRYYRTLETIKDEIEYECMKPLPKEKQKYIVKKPQQPIRETAATLKRMNKRIQIAEAEEVLWLQNLMSCCKNTSKAEELEEKDRQERERQRLYDIERKHLVGQISYEEALIAKQRLQEENKKKYEEFIKERETWNLEIEKWKKAEIEKNRKQVEKLSMIELNLLHAKNSLNVKKKETAEKLKKESEMRLEKAMKDKQEELDRRINMIKEIKILALIAKKARLPKIIDLTETSGLGLLCEMSMAELQERLNVMKVGLKDELEKKKKLIKCENLAAKQELENTKAAINDYMTERSTLRKQNKKQNEPLLATSSNEIDHLKRVLEEKRKLRIKLKS